MFRFSGKYKDQSLTSNIISINFGIEAFNLHFHPINEIHKRPNRLVFKK